MTDAPAPLITPDVDVSSFEWLPLNVNKLLGSDTWALATGDEAKAAVTLWCRAWRQVPAGSLPNDPRVLAASVGTTLARWRKLSPVALRGFILCSDGRLYHRLLCESAVRAFLTKGVQKKRTDAARAALAAKRHRDSDGDSDVTTSVTETATESRGRGRETDTDTTPTSPPPPDVSPREDSPATTTAALSRKVKGVKPEDVRDAVLVGSLYRLLVAFGAKVGAERDLEWQRDCDGLQLGSVAAILAWKRWQKDLIREPSGFRKARVAWFDMSPETRRELIERLLPEYGLQA